jgi:hypothetical protein
MVGTAPERVGTPADMVGTPAKRVWTARRRVWVDHDAVGGSAGGVGAGDEQVRSMVHDGVGNVGIAGRDAAGIGRLVDHDAAGIGRSMIHDAAGGPIMACALSTSWLSLRSNLRSALRLRHP